MGANSLQLFQEAGLSVNSEYNYSEVANAFLSKGFTSNAGNTYFNAVRLIEGISIKEEVGHGHTHTFLNGIKIYSIKEKVLIAERSYHCKLYSKLTVISQVQKMLFDVLKESVIKGGVNFDESAVKRDIQQITSKGFNTDQREMLHTIQGKSLIA